MTLSQGRENAVSSFSFAPGVGSPGRRRVGEEGWSDETHVIFVFLYCKARTYVEQPDCSGVSQESGAIQGKVGISARRYNSRESSSQKMSCPINLKLPCSGRGQLSGSECLLMPEILATAG